MPSDPWRTEITWLFRAAMLVSVLTVVLGILNGQQIVTPRTGRMALPAAPPPGYHRARVRQHACGMPN